MSKKDQSTLAVQTRRPTTKRAAKRPSVTSLQKDLKATAEALAEATFKLNALEQVNGMLQGEVDKVKAELARVRVELTESQKECKNRIAEQGSAEAKVAHLKEELTKVTLDRATARDELGRVNRQRDDARQQLEGALEMGERFAAGLASRS